MSVRYKDTLIALANESSATPKPHMHDLDETPGSSDGTPFVVWEVVGDRTVDEVITIGRAGDRSGALTKMRSWGRCTEGLHVVNARSRLHRNWAIVHADWRR